MAKEEQKQPKGKYVYVKDADGTEYVCRIEDLRRLDQLSETEKAACMIPPGSA